MFSKINVITDMAQNILNKRYLHPGENNWEDIAKRVVSKIIPSDYVYINDLYEMILHRYFIPNSPCLVNAGKLNGGLNACFVVDFKDSIEEIYKTKLRFALIAKKGGGCGTTLTKIRPENDKVSGSAHGYAGGPVKFFDTICSDMKAMTQSGFREMAMMGTISVYHPDILKFIKAKTDEGKMHTTNISVVVDNSFMKMVINNENYYTSFNGKNYSLLNAKDVFEEIVNGAWLNGEPGLLFYEQLNNSPYKHSGQEILATNPCGEQPLPPNGVCNLGSLDISKFVLNGDVNYDLLEKAVRLGVYFLDKVIDVSSFPTEEISDWAKNNRPVGLGIMGLADLFLLCKISYGSPESLSKTKEIMSFIQKISYEESENLGEIYGVPKECLKLPKPRRNITVLSIAPTGSISLLAGCTNGIEPVFSELTQRKDKTGQYEIFHSEHDMEYFRCAVSANGASEVSWKEHLEIQNIVQKYVDSGVSKTINFPNSASKDDIKNAFIYAWNTQNIKGITVYRNGSRQVEVLSPKNIKKDVCPVCSAELIKEAGCKHCSKCEFSVCEIG